MGDDIERTSRHLLIVDSDVDDLYYTSMILQRFEYNVCTATRGTDALEMALAAPPTLIIADDNITDMSGLDLLQRLQQDVLTAAVPVIVKTAAMTPRLEQQYRRDGAVAFVRSPVQAEELYRTVQAAIEASPRSNLRIHTRLPGTISGMALDFSKGECVSDLSEHGMFVRRLQPCPSDTVVPVQFEIKDRSVTAEAQVLYCRTFGQIPFKEPGVGLKFVRIAPQDRIFIRAFIEEELLKGMVLKRSLTPRPR